MDLFCFYFDPVLNGMRLRFDLRCTLRDCVVNVYGRRLWCELTLSEGEKNRRRWNVSRASVQDDKSLRFAVGYSLTFLELEKAVKVLKGG